MYAADLPHRAVSVYNDLIKRKVYAEVPPKVEYSLTEAGYSLKIIHDAMWQWGEEYKKMLGQQAKNGV